MTDHLPTADQMLANADTYLERAVDELDRAADELRSDWQPAGSNLTAKQAARRTAMRIAITEAKAAIEAARHRHE